MTGRSLQRLNPILPRPSSESRNFSLLELAAVLVNA
jgi:hypothetical protein